MTVFVFGVGTTRKMKGKFRGKSIYNSVVWCEDVFVTGDKGGVDLGEPLVNV